MKYFVLFGSSLLAASPVLAQGPSAAQQAGGPLSEPQITVTASGQRQAISNTGQSVSVISADEIAAVQGADPLRVLQRAPGVTFARSGGIGSQTSLFVRGANADQLLVLLDGVRLNDVAAPGGGFDFGTLTTGGVGKLELLRGSNSVIWGSQAMAGVLALTSREFTGVEASAEYGARNSFDGQVNAGVAGDRYALNLNGGYTRTDGISAAAKGIEPDAFRQWRIGGRGRLDLTDTVSATLAVRHADSRQEFDGFPAPLFVLADTLDYQIARQSSARAGLRYDGLALTLDAGYALSDTRRHYYAAPGKPENTATFGRSERADLSGQWRATDQMRVNFGADTEWSRFSTLTDKAVKARLSSGHVLLGWESDAVNLAAGVRVDDHSRFGTHWTFGANGSVALGDGWRVRASYGEGFKAPTLFQLLSNFGNAQLRPETSRSFDAGIEKGDRNGSLHFALTGFRRDSNDLIDYVSCFGLTTGICLNRPFGTYGNVAKARAEGFEVELGTRLAQGLAARAAYSYVKATNRITGKDLPRRPRHALTASVDWTAPFGLTIGGDARLVSDSFDGATRLDGHPTFDIRASVPVGDHFELFGRVENLTNDRTPSVAGYGVAGRSAYGGVRGKW